MLPGPEAFVLNRLLMAPYEKLLGACLKWRYVTVAGVTGACIISAGMLAGGIVKWQFVQDMDSESMICALEMPIGTSTERLKEELQKLTDFIVDKELFPEVVNVQTIAGRQYDVTGAGAVGFDDQSHLGQLVVEICPAEERTRSSEELTTALREFSEKQLIGVNSVRWTEMNGGPGGNDIEISVSGLPNSELPKAVNDLKQLIGGLDGVYDLDDNLDIGKKEMRLSLRDSAAAAGVTVGSLGDIRARSAVRPGSSPNLTQSGRRADHGEIPRDVSRKCMECGIDVDSRTGRLPGERSWIPISEVAEVKMSHGYSTISRFQQTRSAKIIGAVDDAAGRPARPVSSR